MHLNLSVVLSTFRMCLEPSKVFDKRRSKSNELFLIEYKMARGNQGPIL